MSGEGRNEPQAGGTGDEAGALGRETGGRVPSQREGGSSGPGVDASPSPSAPSDADLVLRIRGGDDSAYEELFRRHADAVRRYARTCCRDAHTADDLTAEVFARTLQAVRGGAGPEQAVRAYLLTAVRRVAAAWARSARREQLVEDFAAFADQAASATGVRREDTLELGADVRAMHEAERSMALQAFRSLPERWQAVLWHTTVEEEPPSAVAPLFGLTANATAVLAGRAREGLKQAYLQAHVSSALTSGGDCARYADRLGAYARGGLRMRAERGLRKHLETCVRCRLAAGELDQVNSGIPALLPVAVIGWFAAGYSFKAAGVVTGGAAGAGAAAAGSAAGSAGAAAGAGSASGGYGGAGGTAAAEGLAAPVKAGIAAAVAAAVGAGLMLALAGEPAPAPKPLARPPVAQPVVPAPPASTAPSTAPSPVPPPLSVPDAGPAAAPRAPTPAVPPAAAPGTSPSRARPAPAAPQPPAPVPVPFPPPGETPSPSPTTPPPPTTVHRLNRLQYGVAGDHTRPEVRLGPDSWVWKRHGMSIGGTRYEHGVSVHARSSVMIDLNRECTSYDALVGVDDMTPGLGAVRFSVYADGARRWRSPMLRGGDPAVPLSVGLTGRETLRLVVEPVGVRPLAATAIADWARSRITCV
ncbi:sigma-70 family RNA polymerase sigma factor [Streptomyces sp. HNM0645]|uniref:sigma-70 family RNA polymerase sigma factor n=1 Tax=Streptomyces sp. HNM0645 TaxID=2782343 RepID=UPI0024B78383|nr:sigma-70 family RNA polymerase sigma factor [Streptomyces sp. HNM0645]MDI9886821.1 sigma-70 family RNA polymerase sigma factor [Streptomyces sp. HNM0645]